MRFVSFVPEEYWTIDGKFIPKGAKKLFPASFYGDLEGNKIKITNKEQADGILAELEDAEFNGHQGKKGYPVGNLRHRRSSPPPYSRRLLGSWAFKHDAP